jgi:transcriptional regulator with XRE-family HTH domain
MSIGHKYIPGRGFMSSGNKLRGRPTERKRDVISQAVIDLRMALGQTQQEFAQSLGNAITTVARWETSRPPSGRVLQELSDFAFVNGLIPIAQIFVEALRAEAVRLDRGAPEPLEQRSNLLAKLRLFTTAAALKMYLVPEPIGKAIERLQERGGLDQIIDHLEYLASGQHLNPHRTLVGADGKLPPTERNSVLSIIEDLRTIQRFPLEREKREIRDIRPKNPKGKNERNNH